MFNINFFNRKLLCELKQLVVNALAKFYLRFVFGNLMMVSTFESTNHRFFQFYSEHEKTIKLNCTFYGAELFYECVLLFFNNTDNLLASH
jgi:hypothetical protein